MANFKKIIELFTPKIVTKLSKIWVKDPGSEIRKKPIPDPGSRGQKGTGSRIRNTVKKLPFKYILAKLKGFNKCISSQPKKDKSLELQPYCYESQLWRKPDPLVELHATEKSRNFGKLSIKPTT